MRLGCYPKCEAVKFCFIESILITYHEIMYVGHYMHHYHSEYITAEPAQQVLTLMWSIGSLSLTTEPEVQGLCGAELCLASLLLAPHQWRYPVPAWLPPPACWGEDWRCCVLRYRNNDMTCKAKQDHFFWALSHVSISSSPSLSPLPPISDCASHSEEAHQTWGKATTHAY